MSSLFRSEDDILQYYCDCGEAIEVKYVGEGLLSGSGGR